MKDLRFVKAVGCDECEKNGNSSSGYEERPTGVFEVLFPSKELTRLYGLRDHRRAIRETVIKSGHLTLRDAAMRKALLGQTTLAQVASATSHWFY